MGDFPKQLAQMEAEQSGDLLPCGWCGLHHDQGKCTALKKRSPDYVKGFADGWARARAAESWTDWADRHDERWWAERSNGGRGDV